MGHDIEAARAKAEASFRKPDQSGESTIAQAQREVREQIERLAEEHGLTLDETTVGRALKALGFRKLSARPRHHAQDEQAISDFKKASRLPSRPSGPSF